MKIKKITEFKTYFEVENEGKFYLVELNPVSCTCPQYKYRNIRSGEFCKHITEVIIFLQDEFSCKNNTKYNNNS